MAGVARAFSAADGASVPQWWLTAFTQASAMAQQLLGSIERVLSEGWTNGATEWTLPKNARALLADGTELFLRGRIDLVLSRGSGPLWVVDYKTGARSRPSASVMANTGVGLQVLLYALALKAAGAEEVQLTLASPLDPLVPQATAGELLDDPKVASLLSTLQVMQRTGVFGMKGGMAEEYGAVAQYPLAMLPVNDSILAAKRAITFGME